MELPCGVSDISEGVYEQCYFLETWLNPTILTRVEAAFMSVHLYECSRRRFPWQMIRPIIASNWKRGPPIFGVVAGLGKAIVITSCRTRNLIPGSL